MREFVYTSVFDRQWARLEFSEHDRQRLEKILLDNPQTAPVIEGTGGVRKLRFAFEERGKSGGARVLYVDFVYFGKLYFLGVYAKNARADISKEEKNDFKKLVSILKSELEGAGNE
jgi:hypothetical protein